VTDPGRGSIELLNAAHDALGEKASSWGASSNRSATFLARQALETAIGQSWTGEFSGLNACSFFDQLLCLPVFLGDQIVARQARHVWCLLSRACHAHPYELSPTASEVQGWIRCVQELLEVIEGLAPTGG
jgi:hypothetical protein